jgi:hypothetical protein
MVNKQRILKDIKAGERKSPMPSPKKFTNRKKQAQKTACRKNKGV